MTAPLKTPANVDPKTTPGHRFDASWFWRALPSGMRRRWWLFRPFDLIARHWPLFKRPRGLLVVRMDGIGDMVLFRNALDHYAMAFNVDASDITVLGCKSWGSISKTIFAGYRVHVIDEHAYARHPIYRFRVSLWVRRLAPAVAVSDSYFRRALMADSLVWVSGAPRKIVSLPYINEPTRSEFTYYLSQANEIINTGVYPTHEVIRHFRFISEITGRQLKPEVPAITWRNGKSPVGDGAPYVVLIPGSNEPGRRWPIAGYLEVAEKLLRRGCRIAFVGSPEERPDDSKLKAFLMRPGVIDLYGRTSLPELLDLLVSSAAVLSNDTGPAHLAIALGKPTVVVVGGGHFGGFFPYPEEATPANARFVFQEMSCYHCFWRCHKRATKRDVFPCIDAVEEVDVFSALTDLMEQSPHMEEKAVSA